jgi:hypothetical protein
VLGAWPSTYIRQLGPAEFGEACGVAGVDAAAGAPAARDPCSGDSCKIFNSLMAPFQPGPFEFAGLVWLQGETDRSHPSFYNCALPAFVSALRARFNANLYAVIIQLAPWVAEGGPNVALLREAQSNASSSLTGAGLVASVDLGDPLAPAGGIHSRLKAPVGQRAAWLLLAGLCGNATYANRVSPRFFSAAGSARGATLTATVAFAPGTTAGGLQPIAGAHCPTELGVPVSACSFFSIGASDGAVYNASAAIGAGGDTLVLTATAAQSGLSVRNTSFGFSDYPVAQFTNGLGLPVLPWTPQPVA